VKSTIAVIRDVLASNSATAEQNRARLRAAGVLAVNLLSAPGSGKTSLLQQTVPLLGADACAVLVGDLQTVRDAERLAQATANVVQINTGAGCHLSAAEVAAGLDRLDLAGVAYVFIENIGNMVCPAEVDLGEHVRAALLSVTEGDDKVAKYPLLFQSADIILLSKTDLLGAVEFDEGRVRADLSRLNTRAPLVPISAKTGAGLDPWLGWLRDRQAALRSAAA
jgi:hydrogenase nickel incorporation protein HypB